MKGLSNGIPKDAASQHPTVTFITLSLERVKELLPHRDQWLLIDRATVYTNTPVPMIDAFWRVRPERVFGHFEQQLIMPGVLWLEMAYQAGGLLMGQLLGGPVQGMAYTVREAKFLKPALPEQTVRVRVARTEVNRASALFQATGTIEGEIAFSSMQSVVGRIRPSRQPS